MIKKYKIQTHKCKVCGKKPAYWSKMADEYICEKHLRIIILNIVRKNAPLLAVSALAAALLLIIL